MDILFVSEYTIVSFLNMVLSLAISQRSLNATKWSSLNDSMIL